MVETSSQDKEHLTIILHSGSYDRASYALSIAIVALASGLNVYMLLTFEGLKRFTKEHIGHIGDDTSVAIRDDLEQVIQSGIFQTIEVQLANAKESGLKLYACPNAMAALNIGLPDLVDEVDEVMGLSAFLGLARSATVNLYI